MLCMLLMRHTLYLHRKTSVSFFLKMIDYKNLFVDQYKENIFQCRFKNATEASIELKLNRSHISSVCRGGRKSCGGFTFKYNHGEDLLGEQWREYDSIKISNFGRVYKLNKSVKSFGHLNSGGYYTTQIKRKQYQVHRLVMYAFVGYSDLPVDHIDQDRENNRLENLRYVTISENNQNRKKPSKRKHCHTCSCLIK